MIKLQYLCGGLQILRANIFNNVKIPLSVYLVITDRCPHACKYCNYKNLEKRDALTTNDVKKMIDELQSLGTQRFQITGGEPMLRDDIGEIVRYAKSRGLFVGISTSGFRMQERIKDIKDVDIVFLSLDGEEQVHDYLRGPGSFKMAMGALQCMKKAQVKYWTTTVITTKNIKSIDYIINLAETHGHQCNFVLTYQENQALNNIPSTQSLGNLIPTNEQNRQAVSHILEKKRLGSPIGSTASYLQYLLEWGDFSTIHKTERLNGVSCWAGKLCCTVTSDGLLYACGPAIGIMEGQDIKKLGFKKAFESSKPIRNCNSCIHACWLESNLIFSLNIDSIRNWISKL